MSNDGEQGVESARILYVTRNVTTGEDWATIETVGYTPAAPVAQLGVPARHADTIVSLINDAHRHLFAAIEACAHGDPAWRIHMSRIANTAAEIERTVGRPPLPPGETRAEQVTAYFEAHGLEATMQTFNLSADTVLRYQRRAGERGGQKSD